jgi:predicted nucleic acid-binding protein
MKLVLNASPLIHIVRAGYSWVLEKIGGLGEITIPEEVYRDVVMRGKEKGAPDAHVIEGLVEEGVIKVAQASDKEFLGLVGRAASGKLMPLHKGEAEVLALAREKGALAIVDEAPAREVGRVLNVPTRGSLYMLILLYERKILGKEEVLAAFDAMVKTGWRISPRDYEMIKEELERL